MTLTIKRTLKFTDVYIAYLPLVVFLLNFLYGFLNLEGSTVSNESSRYGLFFWCSWPYSNYFWLCF